MSRLPQSRRPVLRGGLVAALLAFTAGPIVVGAQDEAPAGVVNYTRVDATVACAGATPSEAMPAIKELGFASRRRSQRGSWTSRPPRSRAWTMREPSMTSPCT